MFPDVGYYAKISAQSSIGTTGKQYVIRGWEGLIRNDHGSAHERLSLLWIQIRGGIEPILGGRWATQEVNLGKQYVIRSWEGFRLDLEVHMRD